MIPDVLAARADDTLKTTDTVDANRREAAHHRLVTALESGTTEEIEATAGYFEMLVGMRVQP